MAGLLAALSPYKHFISARAAHWASPTGALLTGGGCSTGRGRHSHSHPGVPHPAAAVAFALLGASQSLLSTGAAPP